MVESMSRRVEGQLYEMRESLESYIDLSTLDARLQALALVKHREQEEVLQDALRRPSSSSTTLFLHSRTAARTSTSAPIMITDHGVRNATTTRTRTEQLVHVLGGIGRYRQIQKILQEIRDEQENLLHVRGQPTQHPSGDSSLSTAATGASTTSSSRSNSSGSSRMRRIMEITHDEATPDPVRDLFVETQELQRAFEKTPMELLGAIDWTLLIARTQTILRTFREWNGDVTV